MEFIEVDTAGYDMAWWDAVYFFSGGEETDFLFQWSGGRGGRKVEWSIDGAGLPQWTVCLPFAEFPCNAGGGLQNQEAMHTAL